MDTILHPARRIGVVDEAAAVRVLTEGQEKPGIVVSNVAHPQVFSAARAIGATTMLVTDSVMDRYSADLGGKEDQLLDHVIAAIHGAEWLIDELRISIQKILRHDLFGIDKYLMPRTVIHQRSVRESKDREGLNHEVAKFVESLELPQSLIKMAWGMTEELLMNAIYDAPVRDGKFIYAHLPRTTPVSLREDELSTLSWGCDGRHFAISVRDPFGALQQRKLYEYIRKVLRRGSGDIIDTKEGGAGLGLYKILFSSHAMICNVTPGKCTEVIALVDVELPLRDFSKMPRSIHYFS